MPPGDYYPVTQVYGTCVKGDETLLIRKPNGRWQLVGGKPEEGETYEETLIREALEEAQAVIKPIRMIAAQEVVERQEEPYYQLRFLCELIKLGEPAIDPADEVIYERRVVLINEAPSLLGWGEIGERLFEGLLA